MFTVYGQEDPFLRAAYILYAHLTAASAWRISCKFIREVVARRQREIYIRSPSWLQRSARQHGEAFRRRRLTRKRVCLNSATSACRTKRWIPAPDQRSWQEIHKFHPPKVLQGQDGVHDGKPGRPCNVTDGSCWNPGNQEAFEYGASVRSNRHYQTTSFYVYHRIGLGMQRCEYQPPT